MSRLHIGRDGTPKNCIAQEGNCPLANPLAHFEARGTAEEFADRYNELYEKGYNFVNLDPDKDIQSLHDAELVYISEYIRDHSEENEEYSDYHNKVRWQVTNRNNAIKELKNIDSSTRKDLDNLSGIIDRERELRFAERENREFSGMIDGTPFVGVFYPKSGEYKLKTPTTKEKVTLLQNSDVFKEIQENRKREVETYKETLSLRKSEMVRITEEVKNKKEKYDKQLEKKTSSESIIYEYMEKRIRNRAILDIEESVNNEIDTRLLKRKNG